MLRKISGNTSGEVVIPVTVKRKRDAFWSVIWSTLSPSQYWGKVNYENVISEVIYQKTALVWLMSGAAYVTRTRDLRITNAMLYRLS